MVNFLGEETEQKAPVGYKEWFKPENQPAEHPEAEEHFYSGLPAQRDPFDPAPLIDLFKKYHSEIDKMANKSMGLMVTDDQSLELATVFTTQAKA